MLDIPEDTGMEEEAEIKGTEPIEKEERKESEKADENEQEHIVEIEEESKFEETMDPTEDIKEESFSFEFIKPFLTSKGFIL